MRNIRIATIFVMLFSLLSCKKYLDATPDASLAIPSSIQDLQSLLDEYALMNTNYPYASEEMADNIYVVTEDFNARDQLSRDLYTWQKNSNTGDRLWTSQYKAIVKANVVLDELPKINFKTSEQAAWNNANGSALFFRSYYYYALAQLFSQPYDNNTAVNDLGLPLRLTSDVNEISKRSSVQNTYDQIISDLKRAGGLLPIKPLFKTRPSKPAAFGALAKTYLAMQQYDSAGRYADLCLTLYDSLIDYNSLNPNATAPISQFNKEVIFHMRSASNIMSQTMLPPSRAKIDPALYNLYSTNDLRKTVLFKANTGTTSGTYAFKGDYDGQGTNSGFVFGGIVTDEMYLIRAESNARKGNVVAAMNDLNKLLQTRWKNGFFQPLGATDANDALVKILVERRKELVFRGTRWTDLRRLMKEPQFAITLKRIVNNQTYELVPNSPRYSILFPGNVISFTGMAQNP